MMQKLSCILREEMSKRKEQVFKTCPMCGKEWLSQDSFLDDPDLNFNGYQPDFDTLEQGIFFFTHEIPSCGSTLALQAESFLPLYPGRKYQENKQLSEECPQKCFNREDLDRCPAHCMFAFVREVSQIIKDRSHQAI